jgi:hypothetical protein
MKKFRNMLLIAQKKKYKINFYLNLYFISITNRIKYIPVSKIVTKNQ